MVESGQQDQRIGNDEREAAIRELSFHTNSGRLTADELAERTTAVEAARTRGDLDAIFADLPPSGAQPYGPRPTDAPAPAPADASSTAPAPRQVPEPAPPVAQPQGQAPPPAPYSGRSSMADRLMVGSGTLALIAFVLCGFLLNGWAWAWVFFLVPGLLRVFFGADPGPRPRRDRRR